MVEFANYAPLPQGYLGHPEGLEWFCDDDLAAAKSVADKSSEDAIRFLKSKYGTPSMAYPTQPRRENVVKRFLRYFGGA